MSGVIYADVLIVVNIYITYLLLKSTALITRKNPDRLRLTVASVLGGFYSLTVLLPDSFSDLLVALRLFAAVLFVFVAFGFSSFKAFLRLNVSFFSCSFIFAGLMFALWYFVCPRGMYFNGAVVYFDIDILTLVVLTVICYAFLKLFDFFFRSRAPVNTIFYCKITLNDKEITLKSFLDTGNRLCDCFSGKPVIIADKNLFKDIFPEEILSEDCLAETKMHYIFCDTLGGKSMLPAFSPERIHIKGAESDFYTDKAVIALTDKRLLQGEYDAILPMGLFENNFDRKDERESEEASAVF